ncbi:hypothetical protein [Leifsonia sp. TF02-11]|uniref:hypothetical protein n=1 Tax=Leifsonia sp. TF02-11 TaxID=2815212 RepID=UPI001AA105A2|nr:hypothetical protein [Leifsonia sp. TF02-11]MBO1738872.1 hypothetical protein [Leifsonia sp. TF02-11]
MSSAIVVILASFVVVLALGLALGAVIVRTPWLQGDRARAAALGSPSAWSALAGITLSGYGDDERVRGAVDGFLAAGRPR